MVPGKFCDSAVEFLAAVLVTLHDLVTLWPKSAVRKFICGEKWVGGQASLPPPGFAVPGLNH